MALEFKWESRSPTPTHVVRIGSFSKFNIEKLTEKRYRIRTSKDDPSTGWGAEITRDQAVELIKALAQLLPLMAEDEDDA